MSATTHFDESPPRKAADRILEAARDLFYRLGIRSVGVEEVVSKAGVTKPSLYRAFGSKDELTTAYLREYDARFWALFDAAMSAHPGDPEGQILAFVSGLAERAGKPGYRGCGLTNACVEYPDRDHPARQVPVANKTELRRRLREMAREMGAESSELLGDGLLLLIEGAYVSVHIFGDQGPALSLPDHVDRLIQSHLMR